MMKKLWNIKVMVMPIVVSALGKVSQKPAKEIRGTRLEVRGSIEIIPTKVKISLEESWRFKKTCSHSDFREKQLKLPWKTTS